jgi:hypothetical protein
LAGALSARRGAAAVARVPASPEERSSPASPAGRNYVELLEASLFRAAEVERRRSPAGRIARSAAALPRSYSALAAVGIAAVVAAVVALSSGSGPDRALALPVLGRPTLDASKLRPLTPVLAKANARFKQARAIETPYGTGYVIVAPDRALLCLAIPDIPDGYGETCRPIAEARQRGIVATLIAAQGSSNSSEFVAILPAAAQNPEVEHADGRITTLPLHDGVAAAAFKEDVTVTLRVGKSTRTIKVPAHEPEGLGFADCGHGRIAPSEGPVLPGGLSASARRARSTERSGQSRARQADIAVRQGVSGHGTALTPVEPARARASQNAWCSLSRRRRNRCRSRQGRSRCRARSAPSRHSFHAPGRPAGRSCYLEMEVPGRDAIAVEERDHVVRKLEVEKVREMFTATEGPRTSG